MKYRSKSRHRSVLFSQEPPPSISYKICYLAEEVTKYADLRVRYSDGTVGRMYHNWIDKFGEACFLVFETKTKNKFFNGRNKSYIVKAKHANIFFHDNQYLTFDDLSGKRGAVVGIEHEGNPIGILPIWFNKVRSDLIQSKAIVNGKKAADTVADDMANKYGKIQKNYRYSQVIRFRRRAKPY